MNRQHSEYDLAKDPPHSLEGEMCTIGSLLLDGNMLAMIPWLTPGDFWDNRHRVIFAAIRELHEDSRPVDLVTVPEWLRVSSSLEGVGGLPYLAQLAESVPAAVNIEHYAAMVKRTAAQRKLISFCNKVAKKCWEDKIGSEWEEMIAEVQKEVLEITTTTTTTTDCTIAQAVKEASQEVQDEIAGTAIRLNTEFWELDNKLLGLRAEEFYVVGARPGMGKSAFAANLARNIAKTGKPVGFISLEMGRAQIGRRVLSDVCNVEAHLLNSGHLPPGGAHILSLGEEAVKDWPFFVDDKCNSLWDVASTCRRWARVHNVRFIVVDYLQLVEVDGKASREQEVSTVTRKLKNLARELKIPIMGLSQLNRESPNRQDKRPIITDLRESGAIEQDADCVMFLHREDYYRKPSVLNPPTNIAEVIIAKRRNGQTGTVNLKWSGAFTRFSDPETGNVVESHHEPYQQQEILPEAPF